MKKYYIMWEFEKTIEMSKYIPGEKTFFMRDSMLFSSKEECLKYGLLNQNNFNCKVIDFKVDVWEL